jgi:tetratricopeptide (TPR) repeat protein
LALLVAATPARAGSIGDQQMLAGARHFQAGDFAAALVEFRVAAQLGDKGATWYLAATLVKLKRSDAALEEFARAEALAPEEEDGLFDYYHALACYEARLYRCADHLLTRVGDRSGPHIGAQARKVRADLAPVLSQVPPVAAVDWYHDQARAALKAGREPLAAVYLREASEVALVRPDRHRRAEALAALARIQELPRQAAQSP